MIKEKCIGGGFHDWRQYFVSIYDYEDKVYHMEENGFYCTKCRERCD